MKRPVLFAILVACWAVLAACGGGAGGSSTGKYETDFPMPASVSNFTAVDSDSVNFQTDLSVEESIAFYREAFTGAGLSERTINTAITDETFSMVFDGDPGGRAIVVQGVDLGNGSTNINIRYEDV